MFPRKYGVGNNQLMSSAEVLMENRALGEVEAMPMLPSLLTKNSDEVAELMLKAGVFPVALETLTDRTALGEVEAMPMLP